MMYNIQTAAAQIEMLEHLGMEIGDKGKAEEILGDIGYYRLGFYWFPFEKMYPAKINRDHMFKEGTRFDTIVRLYYFDFDLRHLLIKYISRIEIHLRTVLVNTMALRCRNSGEWFVNDRIVSQSYVNGFDKIYDRVRLSPYIKAHHRNHSCKYAPARKTLEFMTFGEIIDLVEAITDVKTRLEIALHFGIHSLKTFSSYLSAIKRIRNRCAHGGVLYDYAASIRLVGNGPVDLSNVYDRFNLNGSIKVIEYFVGVISENRRQEMMAEVKKLVDNCRDDENLYNAISISSGIR